jgi:hypothetical protein
MAAGRSSATGRYLEAFALRETAMRRKEMEREVSF